MPNVRVVSVYVDQLERQADAAPSPYQLAMTRAKVAPSSAAKGIAGGLGKDRAVKTQPAPERTEPSGKPEQIQISAEPAPSNSASVCAATFPRRCVVVETASPSTPCWRSSSRMTTQPTTGGRFCCPATISFSSARRSLRKRSAEFRYFNHKRLSYSFEQAQTMVKTANRLRFPLLAGSSLPLTWRLPDVDIPLGAQVEEAVMVGVGSLDGMDFDALEALQCMLERRKGGETGVKAVQLLEGDDVWAAGNAGRWSKDLLSSALSRSDTPMGLTVLDGRTQDLVASGVLPQLVKDPAAYSIEYTDGTRATLLLLNGAIMDYNIAARVEGHGIVSTQFFLPPPPNVTDSACLAAKIEQMFHTGSAAYPVERTLLTTGVLEACLHSRHRMNQRLETPQLAVSYQPPADSIGLHSGAPFSERGGPYEDPSADIVARRFANESLTVTVAKSNFVPGY